MVVGLLAILILTSMQNQNVNVNAHKLKHRGKGQFFSKELSHLCPKNFRQRPKKLLC